MTIEATDTFSLDEVVMLSFLTICVPSLDPESYENVLGACHNLCLTRPRLNKDSIGKCLKHIFGDGLKEPNVPSEHNSFLCSR